jgi:hypothetical protein
MNKIPKQRKRGRPSHPLTTDVERLWIDHDGNLRPMEIWKRVNKDKPQGSEIDLRIVQRIIKDLRDKAGDISRRPWTPWNEHTTPRLMMLDLISRQIFDHPIRIDEAEWASVLEEGIAEIDPFIQLVIIREYTIRNRIAKIHGEPSANTTDLDTLLAIRPWKDDGELWAVASVTEVGPPSLFSLDFRTSDDVNVKDIQAAASRNLRDWVQSSLGILPPSRDLPDPSQLTWRDFIKGSYENLTPEDIASQWARVSPNIGELE